MRFCTLASGSKGNVVYFESGQTRILVDAGISARQLTERLAEISVKPTQLNAICITHEHDDHVSGLVKFADSHNLPVYITRKTLQRVNDAEKIQHLVKYFEGGSALQIEDLKITSFPISHDAADPHGFIIENRIRKVAVATDMGYVTKLVCERLKNMDWLIIEANYDELMLKQGPYPLFLKQRIMGKHGHLSNIDSAVAIRGAHHDQLKGVFLAHLSETNNSQEMAFDTVTRRLGYWQIAGHLKVQVAHQRQCSEVIEL